MILSDRSIREELEAGRIVIEPLAEGSIQPSSVDLHVDRWFRVFRNHTSRVIDVKEDQTELTELVEVAEDGAFILHPGEFALGSTAERVALPDDLVARLEGKSSLGRLGLLIHSSLPASEPVMLLDETGHLRTRPIVEIVRKRLAGSVASFDPETFKVKFAPITGWYEGPPDRIFEVVLASGRRVRVTAGHNLFTLDRGGHIEKVRTGALAAGAMVAIPDSVPDPPRPVTHLDLLELMPEETYETVSLGGPAVVRAFTEEGPTVAAALRGAGYKHTDYYRRQGRLPLHVALLLERVRRSVGAEEWLMARGGKHRLPVRIDVDEDLAWLLGLYVAEGFRRDGQFVVSNTDQAILDRAQAVIARLGLPVYRAPGAITCCSVIGSSLLGWLGTGGKASTKRLPPLAMGWPQHLLQALLDGLVDGDGSRAEDRTSVWTSSEGLVADVLLLATRLGRRAGSCRRERDGRPLNQVYLPEHEHKLLATVPLPDGLLVETRKEAGLDQRTASALAGYSYATDLNNIERRRGRDAVRRSTLRRLLDVYGRRSNGPAVDRLRRLAEGGLRWDRVIEVRDTEVAESVFDLEVRPGGHKVENFLAGDGVFVSNTAGFVDAGWDGHLTLELSNVANLPITLYPGMRIGQISFLRMTTPADQPYGSGQLGSKYQGQRGPTPSRYFENFRPSPTPD